ncbi:hypothetical protein R6Q57_005051 [Mikania cordata]
MEITTRTLGAFYNRPVRSVFSDVTRNLTCALTLVQKCRRGDSGVILSLPPIASNDPIVAWVWSYISSLYLSPLNVRIEVANELCSLANVNDRNRKIIAEEGEIPHC